MKSSVHIGYSGITIQSVLDGEEDTRRSANYALNDRVLDYALNRLAGGGMKVDGLWPSSTPFFYRPSGYRYDKPEIIMNGRMNYPIRDYYSLMDGWVYWASANEGDYDQNYQLFRGSEDTGWLPTDQGREMAVGGLFISWSSRQNAPNGSLNPTAGSHYFLPDSNYTAGPVVSWTDVFGTQIGNVFKHPVDRSAWGNEVGQVAFSQGNLVVGGRYEPPEERLTHRGFRLYITKNGGTGKIITSSTEGGSFPALDNGQTVAAFPERFVDADANGILTATVNGVPIDNGNHYIAIRSGDVIGTFKIKARVNDNEVNLDNVDGNAPFPSDVGLSWSLRTGPIAEYFVQARQYTHAYYWSTGGGYQNAYYSLLPFGSTGEAQALEYARGTQAHNCVVVQKHDRKANWWIVNAQRGTTCCIYRWTHFSPKTWDPTYLDGDITNMPTGITTANDLDMDAENKIWFGWGCTEASYLPDDVNTPLAKIDPYPGGEALHPDCLASYEAQANAADAGGLCSNDVRGIVCDDSGVYTTDRVWIFHGQGTRVGGDLDAGGISYTDNHGGVWKRLHKLTTLTGVADFTNGSPNVAGTGTAFTTELAAGDWIRKDGDDRSYEIASITDAENLVLAGNYQGTTTTDNAIQRGALTADQAQISQGTWNGYFDQVYRDIRAHAPCDFDTNGNLYWCAPDRVCQWVHSEGKVHEILKSSFPGTAITKLKTLTIPKLHKLYHPEVTLWASMKALQRNSLSDGDNFTLTDGTNTATFYFDVTGTYVPGGGYDATHVRVNLSGLSSGTDRDLVADAMGAAVDGSLLEMNYYAPHSGYRNGYAPGGTPAPTGYGLVLLYMADDPAKRWAPITESLSSGTLSPRNFSGEFGYLHNMIFLGAQLEGMVLLSGENFGDYVTRINDDVTDQPPYAFDLTGATERHHHGRAVLDPNNGDLWLIFPVRNGAWSTYRYRFSAAFSSPFASLGNYGQGHHANSYAGNDNDVFTSQGSIDFDEVGLSSRLHLGLDTQSSSEQYYFAGVVNGNWQNIFWDGNSASWKLGWGNQFAANLNLSGDLVPPDYDGAHYAYHLISLPLDQWFGRVTQRAMEIPTELRDGLTVRFDQSGGDTDQTSEYIADETITWLCSVGVAKDNTQEAYAWFSSYWLPTVQRVDPDLYDVKNLWTVDEGLDGGYSESSSTSALPPFRRGVAEIGTRASMVYSGSSYFPADGDTIGGYTQWLAALRLADVCEYQGDAWVDPTIGDGDRFYTDGTNFTFNSTHEGHSLFIEDSQAASYGNNGQAVILEVISGTEVRVDRTFIAGDEQTVKVFRWKLRDVPAVGYLGLSVQRMWHYDRWFMDLSVWSSGDYGQNWSKKLEQINWSGVAVDEQRADEGIYWNVDLNAFYHHSLNYSNEGSHVFLADLRALPENVRRRQYWKLYKNGGSNTRNFHWADVFLMDENFKVLGRPADSKFIDADDDNWHAGEPGVRRLVLHWGSTATPQDNADGDGYTNEVKLDSGSFYEKFGSTGQTVDTGRFLQTGAGFTKMDVLKYIRVVTSGGVVWARITSWISDGEVQTDAAAFPNESGLSWALMNFTVDDEFVVESSDLSPGTSYHNTQLNDLYGWKIEDVAASDTLLLKDNYVPSSIGSKSFYIGRASALGDASWKNYLEKERPEEFGFDIRFGTFWYGEAQEFVEIESGSGATSKEWVSPSGTTDTDGDGRVDAVSVPIVVDSLIAAGDYIMLESATAGRRVYEIRDITRNVSDTDVRLKYDELLPDQTLSYWFRKRRAVKAVWRRQVAIGNEEIV